MERILYLLVLGETFRKYLLFVKLRLLIGHLNLSWEWSIKISFNSDYMNKNHGWMKIGKGGGRGGGGMQSI